MIQIKKKISKGVLNSDRSVPDHRGSKNPMYQHVWTKQQKKNMRMGQINSGYKDSEETKLKKKRSALTRKTDNECISVYNNTGMFVCKSEGRFNKMLRDNNLPTLFGNYYRKLKKYRKQVKIKFIRLKRAKNNGHIKYLNWTLNFT